MTDFTYTHIIWDWNGTLFDDAWLCVEIMNGMLIRRNLPRITPQRYEDIFSFPVSEYYRALGFDFYDEPFERLSDEFMGHYNRRQWECGLRDETREVLMLGRRRGITQSILSAMKQETLNEMMAHFKLRDYFTDIVGLLDHHAFGKLDVAEEWLDAQSLDRQRVLLIGDTTHDYQVAQTLRVACWHIYGGHHSRARLAVSGTRIMESLLDVYSPPPDETEEGPD